MRKYEAMRCLPPRRPRSPRSAALPALALLAAATLALGGCEEKVPEPQPESRPRPASEPEAPEPADLVTEDLQVGKGPEAKAGDEVEVHYTGRLKKTNAVFDSSKDRDPFKFTLGEGEVIEGWDKGVAGMKVGGKRKLTIPSKLAYKEAGSPPKIPPNATLVFDVELLSVNGKGAADAKK